MASARSSTCCCLFTFSMSLCPITKIKKGSRYLQQKFNLFQLVSSAVYKHASILRTLFGGITNISLVFHWQIIWSVIAACGHLMVLLIVLRANTQGFPSSLCFFGVLSSVSSMEVGSFPKDLFQRQVLQRFGIRALLCGTASQFLYTHIDNLLGKRANQCQVFLP